MKWIESSALQAPALLPDLHPIVARALLKHGIGTPEAARAFLDPEAYTPSHPDQLPGLSTAADRLETAVRSGEAICVWGDFDVDGQTSTTILFQILQELGANVTYHIPVRARESHGVNVPVLSEIIALGAQLILTCDTGISAHPAVDYARSRGVEMVITDHHDLPPVLPLATAIVNPKLLPENHPLATLSGAGVAYKLAEELYTRSGQAESAKKLLDLAALGLVVDMASLTGETRYIVQLGLNQLRNTRRLGLQIMMETAELAPANLTEEHIGFALGPRLNALGRLGDANPAVELLTTSDQGRARLLVSQLEGYNAQRQLLCNQVFRAAETKLYADPALLALPVLVLAHPSWPAGVVGIVASRLVERYRKPAILFSTSPGEVAHGSARSVEGLNITAAIAAQKDLLLNYGGHPMAAGLSLEQEKLPEFTRRLAQTVRSLQGTIAAEARLEIDAWIGLSDVKMDLAEALEVLAPYGHGNEKLTFATHGVKIESAAAIGRNKEHLRLKVSDESGISRTVFWWNGAEERDSLPLERIDLAYSLRASNWRGEVDVQMEVEDFHSCAENTPAIQTRQVTVVDYRNVENPLEKLASVKNQASTTIWAEGKEKQKVGGAGRSELGPAEQLVIWTIPPSSQELLKAVEIVNPKSVYLFSALDGIDRVGPFLEQLSGLLKYAIHYFNGRISISRLEVITSQRFETIQKGLLWLVAQGNLDIMFEGTDEMVVSTKNSPQNVPTSLLLIAEIQALLIETSAYHTYYRQADKDMLFK